MADRHPILPAQGWARALVSDLPLLRPVAAMLRNRFGLLSVGESITVIAELFILGIIVLQFAVRLSRYGSIEYSRKVSLKTAFNRPAGKALDTR
jgi:hypothetical protein